MTSERFRDSWYNDRKRRKRKMQLLSREWNASIIEREEKKKMVEKERKTDEEAERKMVKSE